MATRGDTLSRTAAECLYRLRERSEGTDSQDRFRGLLVALKSDNLDAALVHRGLTEVDAEIARWEATDVGQAELSFYELRGALSMWLDICSDKVGS